MDMRTCLLANGVVGCINAEMVDSLDDFARDGFSDFYELNIITGFFGCRVSISPKQCVMDLLARVVPDHVKKDHQICTLVIFESISAQMT